MKRIIYIILFTFTMMLCLLVAAQSPTKSELEKRKSNLLKEIQLTQQQLEETKQNKSATLSDLKALQAQLQTRQQLITSINSEINGLDNSIKNTNNDITDLSTKLKSQQKAYASSVRHAYKHKESENFVAFLFSASDFNDAIRRLSYLRRYNEFRKTEGAKIVQTQVSLSSKISALSSQKAEQSTLLAAEKTQTDELLNEKKATDKIVIELKGREKELIDQIAKDKATSIRLESSIKEMIRKEILLAKKKMEEEAAAKKKADEAALAKKKAEEEAKIAASKPTEGIRTGSSMRGETPTNNAATTPTPNLPATKPNTNTTASNTNNNATNKPTKPATTPTSTVNLGSGATKPTPARATVAAETYKMALTPDVQTISNNFSANQGRLPWPLEKGYISGHYGKQAHPLYPSVTIDNLGIDITTNPGSAVRSVFEGTVTKISNIEGYIVMISHGEYFTIYSGLTSVNVKQGDKISAKQNIGVVGKNDDGAHVLNFQVWKITGNNFSTLNPASWIAR